jgi:hypothetical protein
MEKLDLAKKYPHYYKAKTKPEIIELPRATYLSITGKGDPSSKSYLDNIQALYSVAYTLKFLYKTVEKDFVVAKLEGLWWFTPADGVEVTMWDAPLKIPREEWYWRMLIRLPDYVTDAKVRQAIKTVVDKKNIEQARKVELFSMTEGKVVQMLHIGPYSKEPETLEKMDAFMKEHKFSKAGEHHEIYLSDFRKTPPEKLRTILREPVK